MSGRREALLEFTMIGDVVRLAAIDPETGVEVVVMGPAHASRRELEQVAAAKLERAIQRQAGTDAAPERQPRPPRRGQVV